jgi:hypothetical protein
LSATNGGAVLLTSTWALTFLKRLPQAFKINLRLLVRGSFLEILLLLRQRRL